MNPLSNYIFNILKTKAITLHNVQLLSRSNMETDLNSSFYLILKIDKKRK